MVTARNNEPFPVDHDPEKFNYHTDFNQIMVSANKKLEEILRLPTPDNDTFTTKYWKKGNKEKYHSTNRHNKY